VDLRFMTAKARLVVLISGNGSNLQALIDACENQHIHAKIEAVISHQATAYGLQRAERSQIPTLVFYPHGSRVDYDSDLAEFVSIFKPDWIILAGWMRLLSLNFLRHYPNRVINLHPALPEQFPGTHAIERAFEAYQRGEITETGIMIHFVPDEGVDNGPVLAQHVIPILPEDTLETLSERIHATEHLLLVETIRQIIK
jgi:formyltetrahydrofolate-dependent phosphoribosylglycinamide formyltransferase